MKKVLIITYYWIPSGGAGVQRWVKFTKYLRDFGWEPIIYTPENPEYPSEDLSFQKDIPADIQVIKTPIWEPYNVYRNLFGKKGQKINAGFIQESKKSGWKDKLSIWIRGNFLIPDPRRFWIKPSVKYLKNFIEKNPVDAVITTGPPHSMHLIGLGLKKHFPNIPWVADFRDPWTKIFYYKDLMLSVIAKKYHQKLETKILSSADTVMVVSEKMSADFERLTHHLPVVIPNGYDADDIDNSKTIVLDTKFTVSYIGTLSGNQNPTKFWEVLGIICNENGVFKKDLSIQLIGKIDFSVLNEIQAAGLTDNTIKREYMPHDDVLFFQKSTQILLLLLVRDRNAAKGILTGKFFEYLAANRPILAIGPTDGDVAKILNETKAGKIVDFEDENGMRATILDYYEKYKNGTLSASTASIEKYSRRALTKQLSDVLNNSIDEPRWIEYLHV